MLYLALVSLIWAFSFGLIGNVLAGVDPMRIAATRLALALLVFLPFLRPGAISGKDRLRLVTCGAVQFGVMYAAYITAFSYLPSHLVALFSVTTPLFVVLVHDLLARRWTQRAFISALLAVAGAAVIRYEGLETDDLWVGFALMQLAGLAFATGQVYYRAWKRRHRELPTRSIFAWLYLGSLVPVLVASLLRGSWGDVALQPEQWGVLLYLGIVASGLGFFLWNKGATRSRPGTLAAFNNAVVPLGVAVSLFVFGEFQAVPAGQWFRLVLGASLIGLAVWLGNRPEHASPNPSG